MNASLIAELKARREALGWSVKHVSERCGLDEKLLSDWERGIGSPPLAAVQSWAASLDLRLGLSAGARAARPGVRIDWDKRCIAVDGAPVRLTPMEWKALERLAKVPGELVTHEELFRHLYGDRQPYRAQSTAIRVLITKLRRLLPLRIEARWGRGYIISGFGPSAPSLADRDKTAEEAAEQSEPPPPGKLRRDSAPFVPEPVMRVGPASDRHRPDIGRSGRQAATLTDKPHPCRAEELGVIERFLSERGVTRCPDIAEIQRSPLPTLIWDKNKRKWVRPALSGCEGSAGREAS